MLDAKPIEETYGYERILKYILIAQGSSEERLTFKKKSGNQDY